MKKSAGEWIRFRVQTPPLIVFFGVHLDKLTSHTFVGGGKAETRRPVRCTRKLLDFLKSFRSASVRNLTKQAKLKMATWDKCDAGFDVQRRTGLILSIAKTRTCSSYQGCLPSPYFRCCLCMTTTTRIPKFPIPFRFSDYIRLLDKLGCCCQSLYHHS